MRKVEAGDKVKITRADRDAIRRVARTVTQPDSGQMPSRDASGLVTAMNGLDVELMQFSIIGVTANRTEDFYFRSIHWRPPYNTTPKNSVVNYAFQEQDWEKEAWRFKIPTYRDDAGRIGVLQANAPPGKGAPARIAGRTICRVYFKQELVTGAATPDFLPLAIPNSDENEELGFRFDGYPLIYDKDRPTKETYGNARLIRPGTIVFDEENENWYIPEGLQIAEIELMTPPYSFFSGYLDHLDEKPK